MIYPEIIMLLRYIVEMIDYWVNRNEDHTKAVVM